MSDGETAFVGMVLPVIVILLMAWGASALPGRREDERLDPDLIERAKRVRALRLKE